MRDEIDSRAWADHGHAFSEDLGRLLDTAAASFGAGLRRLNEIRFDAPWKHDVRGPGHA